MKQGLQLEMGESLAAPTKEQPQDSIETKPVKKQPSPEKQDARSKSPEPAREEEDTASAGNYLVRTCGP